MKVAVTEIGYDANPSSLYAVPETVDTYSDREKQANGCAYTAIDLWASRVDAFNLYTFKGQDTEANTAGYGTSAKFGMFSTVGNPSVYDSAGFKPRYYVERQLHDIIGSFTYDSTVSYQWEGAYILKGHLVDAQCVVVGLPSNSGLTGNVQVYVGNNKAVKQYELNYNGLTPTVTYLFPVNGYVIVSIEDKPKILTVREISSKIKLVR